VTSALRDLVCGQRVRPEFAETSNYLGHRYYLCSPNCKRQFEREAWLYLAGDTLDEKAGRGGRRNDDEGTHDPI